MTRAYADYYLEDGMMNLGEAVDYAVNLCQMDPDDFMASGNYEFCFYGRDK